MHSSPEAKCSSGGGGRAAVKGVGRGEMGRGFWGEELRGPLLALPRHCPEMEAAGLRVILESGDLG